MRIISGKYRGRLITPPKNLRARPTTDFAKENLFNILANMIDFDDVDVLDLFSGTGSITYEFASRGAKSLTSVEVNNVHHNFIKATSKSLEFENFYPVHANAFLYVKGCKKQFDVIFADPPYDVDGSKELPALIFANDLLREGGLLIMEHSKSLNFTSEPNYLSTRNYGSVNFSFFTK